MFGMQPHFRRAVRVGMICLGCAGSVHALGPARPPATARAEVNAVELDGVGVEEKRGDTLPLDLMFQNEQGQTVRLGDLFDGQKPVILNLGYYKCPMLCGLVLDGLVKSVAQLQWTPGNEYEIVTVSINSKETPQMAHAKKQTTMLAIDRPQAQAGWHFLTGDQQAIDTLTDAVGWRYNYLPEQGEFAHPATIMIVTPEGVISRYLPGVEYDANTVRRSLVDATGGKIGSLADRAYLLCFHYDDKTGQYTADVMVFMRLGGGLTVFVLAGVIGLLLLKEKRRRNMSPYAPAIP